MQESSAFPAFKLTFHRMKILISEDDREYRSLLYSFLHAKGHDVLAVSDAVHTVALLADHSHEIDLVLLDLNTPRLRGDELLQSFGYWRTCKTRFLIVSGCADLERFSAHPRLAGILSKPFPLAKLDELVSQEAARQKQVGPVALAAS
jgi:DNA-binding response OmpR family regulator